MTISEQTGANLVAALEPLSPHECWGLLASAQIGRLGLIVDGQPVVLPINFAIDGETILFRTAEGTVLNEASLRLVAFECDHMDIETHTGWSVLLQGLARDIGDAIDLTSERLRRLSLVTWAPGVRDRWFRIDPDEVTGRRLSVSADAL